MLSLLHIEKSVLLTFSWKSKSETAAQWFKHSILEDVVVKKIFPKKSDYKFTIFRPWRTQIHQEINKSSSPFGDSPFT